MTKQETKEYFNMLLGSHAWAIFDGNYFIGIIIVYDPLPTLNETAGRGGMGMLVGAAPLGFHHRNPRMWECPCDE